MSFQSSNKANTRSVPGANIGRDHDLVLTTMKLTLMNKRFTKSPRVRFDLAKLKDPKIAEVFQAKVDGQFAALCVFDSDVDLLQKTGRGSLLNCPSCPPERDRTELTYQS